MSLIKQLVIPLYKPFIPSFFIIYLKTYLAAIYFFDICILHFTNSTGLVIIALTTPDNAPALKLYIAVTGSLELRPYKCFPYSNAAKSIAEINEMLYNGDYIPLYRPLNPSLFIKVLIESIRPLWKVYIRTFMVSRG